KVVFHRIRGVELAEARGNLDGRAERERLRGAEAEVRGELVDVRVDRDEEERGVDRAGPQAEIDPVGGANHPAEKEEQALAGAGAARIRQEVREAPGARGGGASRGRSGRRRSLEPTARADRVAEARERLAQVR